MMLMDACAASQKCLHVPLMSMLQLMASKHVSLMSMSQLMAVNRHPVNPVKNSSDMHTVVIAGVSHTHTQAHMKPRFAEELLGTALAGTGRRERCRHSSSSCCTGGCVPVYLPSRTGSWHSRTGSCYKGKNRRHERVERALARSPRQKIKAWRNALCWCNYCCHDGMPMRCAAGLRC